MSPRSMSSAGCHTPRVGLGRSFPGKRKVLTGGVRMIKEATSVVSQGLSARPCFLMRKHLFACRLDFYFIKTKTKLESL